MTVKKECSFDVIDLVYIEMFYDIKKHFNEIHVLLHIDQSLNIPEIIKSLLSVLDRKMALLALNK